MELKKIQIKNFRSIKDETIEFNHNCLILLGKNEAGKTNVLKAVAALFGQYIMSDQDKRKKINNEKIAQEDFYIRAIISLNQNDFNKIETQIRTKYSGTERIEFTNGISLNDS